MRTPFLFVAVLSSACFQTYDVPSCGDLSRTEVAMDEETPAGTAGALLATVGLDGRWEGAYDDGAVVDVDVFVAADGAPMWVEQEVVSERKRELGFTRESALLHVVCPNQLELPLLAEVRTADGATEVVLSGTSFLADPDGDSFQPPGVPWVTLHGGYSDGTFPDSTHDPADYKDKISFIELDFDASGFVGGSAGWEGKLDDEDRNSWRAERVVTFAADRDGTVPPTD